MTTKATPAPIHLLAGGPMRRHGEDALLKRILTGLGIAHPTIAYVGAASRDHRGFFHMIAGYLRHCGAGKVAMAALASERADLSQALSTLASADAIFMSGGDVEAGMCILEQRHLVPFLRELYEHGKPFLGISAGSIMLARQWVRWPDPQDDQRVEVFPCLGLAPILCDTHGEAEGWEELRTLLRLMPEGTVGYGIPSGTALRVHPDGRVEALGAPVECYVCQKGTVSRFFLHHGCLPPATHV